MSKRLFIIFQGKHTNEEVDLELPGDKLVGILLPDILKTLNWPTTDGDHELRYHLETEEGKTIEEEKTLREAGVENSDVLRIVMDDSDTLSPDEVCSIDSLSTLEPSPQDRRGSLTPPRRVHIPITQPCLIGETKYIYILGKPPVLIGRKGQNTNSNIDLSEIDVEMIASRKHAEILLDGSQYILKPFQTTNGTYVNGVEVSLGDHHKLKNGDVIQFGFNKGVKLTFRLP